MTKSDSEAGAATETKSAGGRVKLLYVEHAINIGGAEHSLMEMLEVMDLNRFEPIVYANHGAAIIPLLRNKGVRVIEGPVANFVYTAISGFPLRSFVRFIVFFVPNIVGLSRAIRKEKPDIVCINASPPIVSAVLAKRMGTRVVWHFREFMPAWRPSPFRWLLRTLATRYADAVVCNSKAVERDCSVGNSTQIYDGIGISNVSHDEDREVVRREFGVSGEAVCAAYFGQIIPGKGIEIFLKAAALLANEERLRYFVVGGHPPEDGRKIPIYRRLITTFTFVKYENAIRMLAEAFGVDKNVVFAGYRTDVSAVMAAMDVVVVPSRTEALGRVALEAMALKKPVVASNVGGLLETVVDGKTGYVCQWDSEREFADAIYRLANDADMRRDMGRRGYERAAVEFSKIDAVRRLEDIYLKLMERA